MNKVIRTLVIAFLLSCSFNVYAESHDVVAKYNESQNIVTYESSISNGSSTIKVDNGTFTLKIASNDFDGINVSVIKLSGNALDWIKNYTDSKDNYYFYFSKNDSAVNITDKISISYCATDKSENIITSFNSNGDMISTGNNTVTSYKTNFYVSVSNVEKEKVTKKTLELEVDSNGKVMIDGTMYEGNTNYFTDYSSVKVAIIPNNGYEVSRVELDGIDISNSLNNGFVTISLNAYNKLTVVFSSTDVENNGGGYKISGKVIVDGNVVPDAVVILNDDIQSVTNANGEYQFDDVPVGENSILIIKDGKAIGFATFTIVASNIKDFETYEDDGFTIEMGQNSLSFVMDLNVNDDYSIDFSNVELESNYNYIWLIVLGIVIVLGAIIIIVIKKNKTYK